MRTIKLTDEQFETLVNLLQYEIEAEYNLQSQNGFICRDLSWLKDYVALYEAIHKGQAKSFIDAVVIDDDIETKKKWIKELEQEEDIQ